MGLIAPTSPSERDRHSLEGCTYDLEGNVMLESTNLFDNPAFTRINLARDPEGLDIGMPEEPEGFFVYLSEKNKGWSTAAAQNTAPVDINAPTYIFNTVQVGGHAPRTKLSSAPIAAPLLPDVELVPTTRLGFKVGTYQAFYSWVDKQGRHTPLSPSFSVVVSVKGQYLVWDLPDSPPGEANGIGLWLARGGTPRLQVILSLDELEEGTYTMSGPYKNGRTMPNKNQTKPANPRRPTLHRARGLNQGTAGDYKVEVAFVRRNGSESARSPVSNKKTITEEEAARNIYLGVRYGDDAQNIRKRRGTYRRKHGEPRIDPDARYRIYVTRDIGDGPEEFVLENRAREGGAARPFLRGESTSFSGRTKADARPGEPLVLTSLKEAGIRNTTQSGTVKTITPKDDGLEEPDTPIDSVVAATVTKLEPGTYLYGISYWVRGDETAPCTPQSITVPAGWTAVIHFPDPVNALKNAQFTDLDSDDVPFGWTLAGIAGPPNSGSYSMTDSVMSLTTNGPKNTTTQTAPVLSTSFAIDRTLNYAVGGTLSALMNTGRLVARLDELNDAGTIIRSTTLTSITESGQVDFVTAFGPGQLEFLDSAVRGQLQVYFDVSGGTTRDGAASITELFAIPHVNRVRRLEIPDEDYAPDSADALPYVRWRKAGIKAVGPPPKSQRTSPTFSIMDSVDFEAGTLSGTGWTLRNSNPPGTTTGVLTAAAIDGTYGYRFSKVTGSTAYLYLQKTYTPTTRQNLAARAKFRVRRMPTRKWVTILQIKAQATDGFQSRLAGIALDYQGYLFAGTLDARGREEWTIISSGVRVNDVLDLELLVKNAGTQAGYFIAAVGKNGARRSYVHTSPVTNWTSLFARTVQIGFSSYRDPASWIELDVDTFHITTLGDTLSDTLPPPTLEALPSPDRPLDDPVYVDSLDFEGATIPSPWTTSRTPADSTTSVVVEGSAAIDGSYGLRCIDTGTSGTNVAAITRTVARDDLGVKLRFRPTVLPTTGTLTLAQVRDSSGNTLAEIYLSATSSTASDVFARGISAGTSPTPVKLARSVTTSTVVTCEMVLLGTNSSSGLISAWVSVGGAGAREERKLMGQPQPIDWTGRQAGEVRVGLVSQSVSAITANVRFDSVALTESGEMKFVEFLEDEEINQAYAFYPSGQPARDDLWLKGLRLAVRPGRTYTFALWARHAGLLGIAYPYFFTAYDLSGSPYPLGSLYGPSGATGTSGWALRRQTWTIPSGCYEVRMDSQEIGQGEFCCQVLSISPGLGVIPEVTYPETGVAWAVMDVETPLPPPEPLANTSAFENVWLSLGSVQDVPEGTSLALEYGSSDELIEPSQWYTDPSLVTPRRYPQVRATFSSDGTDTPIWRSGSPYIEYVTTLQGRILPKLLRENATEFPGGAWVTGVMFPRGISEYDFRAPKGRTRAHRRTEPIMKIPGFLIRCHSELAYVEIEETCVDEAFVIEIHGRRFKFNFIEQLEFSFVEDDPGFVLNPDDGNYYALMEASCSEVEVLEIAEMTPNAKVSG